MIIHILNHIATTRTTYVDTAERKHPMSVDAKHAAQLAIVARNEATTNECGDRN